MAKKEEEAIIYLIFLIWNKKYQHVDLTWANNWLMSPKLDS